MKNRGQISVEYLIVVSFVTFIVLSVLGIAFFYTSQIQDTIKFNQIERFSKKIISSSESTFYSGEPSRITMTSYLPRGITSIEIIENSILLEVSTSAGEARIAYPSTVPIEGALSSSSGVKRILIVADSDKVTISEP